MGQGVKYSRDEWEALKAKMEAKGVPQGENAPQRAPAPVTKPKATRQPIKMLPKRGIRDQNKTEAEFERILEAEGHADIRFEGITLLIGPNCRYTPDFFSVKDGVGWFHEVKGGFYRDDAMAKFKSAVAQYPMFVWVFAQKKKSIWKRTHFRLNPPQT